MRTGLYNLRNRCPLCRAQHRHAVRTISGLPNRSRGDLKLVERGRVDQQLASASAGNFGGREVVPAPSAFRHIAPVAM